MHEQVKKSGFRERKEAKSLELKNKEFAYSMLFYFSDATRPKLSARAFLVWSALVARSVPIVGITSVSYREIQKMTGIGSADTVSKAMGELIEKGFIRLLDIKGVNCNPSVYQLLRISGGDDSKEAHDIGSKIVDIIMKAEQERRAKAG